MLDTDIRTVNDEKEGIRQALQNQIDRIVLIESVNYKRFLDGGKLSADTSKTDITFVVVNHLRDYVLYENERDELNL